MLKTFLVVVRGAISPRCTDFLRHIWCLETSNHSFTLTLHKITSLWNWIDSK